MFYAVGSSLFLLSVCFLFMFSILSRRCPLLATSCPSFFCVLSMLISDSRFDLVWFRLSCDHGWIRSGSVNVRKQKQQPRPSEHPPVRGENISKRLGGIKGCKYKTSSWHFNGFPYGGNIGSTVWYRGEAHRYTVLLH